MGGHHAAVFALIFASRPGRTRALARGVVDTGQPRSETEK